MVEIGFFRKTLEKEGFETLLRQIAESKKTDFDSVVAKIGSVSGPSLAGTTGVANKSTVERMTDTKGYTGLFLLVIYNALWEI